MLLPVIGDALIDLIPQKPPFVLIDALVKISANDCETTFTVPVHHVLCNKGILSAAGLIENIAQTCAVKAGYEYQLAGKKIPVGFIGDVRHFVCSKRPAANQKIITSVHIEHEVFGVSIISGKIELEGEEIASCQMKIFVNEPANIEQTNAAQYT
jgi:predicted hotdog family 3-hydroxylacyl-ACP dehydratase